MNSDLGSPTYRVIPSDKFTRAAKVMKKSYKSNRESQAFLDCLASLVEQLTQNPRLENSRLEPIPKGVDLQGGWEFHKLCFSVPGRSGASGEGRIMYLVNSTTNIIKLAWLYTHAEFKGRPVDRDLKQLLQDLLNETEEDELS
jgi:hypothetical protein